MLTPLLFPLGVPHTLTKEVVLQYERLTIARDLADARQMLCWQVLVLLGLLGLRLGA